jgi:6-phosphogluconolactonase
MKMRPESAVIHHCADPSALAAALAAAVADGLRSGIAHRGGALLALSGGTTPRRFLQTLAQQELDWSRVIVTLADERWVPPTHARSNERLLRETLLAGRAASSATFVPLYADAPDPESGLRKIAPRIDALTLPFDAVVLGLGSDGHCASLFPDGDHFDAALEPGGTARVMPMRSPTAGEPRMTLTLPVLAATRALYLHIEGTDKQQVLARVLADESTLARSPLRAIVRNARVSLDVYVCP